MDYGKNLDLNDIVYFCEFDNIIKTEQWKDIPDYEGVYMISDLGRVKSLNYRRKKIPRIKKQFTANHGYNNCQLFTKTKTIHQLVAICFLNHTPCGHELVVNHKDNFKQNNKASNLELVSNRQNTNQSHLKTTSKYVGVSWHKKSKKWIVRIRHGRKQKYLGTYLNEIDAHNVYENYFQKTINI